RSWSGRCECPGERLPLRLPRRRRRPSCAQRSRCGGRHPGPCNRRSTPSSPPPPEGTLCAFLLTYFPPLPLTISICRIISRKKLLGSKVDGLYRLDRRCVEAFHRRGQNMWKQAGRTLAPDSRHRISRQRWKVGKLATTLDTRSVSPQRLSRWEVTNQIRLP